MRIIIIVFIHRRHALRSCFAHLQGVYIHTHTTHAYVYMCMNDTYPGTYLLYHAWTHKNTHTDTHAHTHTARYMCTLRYQYRT